jgi:hypothetical protein
MFGMLEAEFGLPEFEEFTSVPTFVQWPSFQVAVPVFLNPFVAGFIQSSTISSNVIQR